jgi:hypothetical protein
MRHKHFKWISELRAARTEDANVQMGQVARENGTVVLLEGACPGFWAATTIFAD